MGGLLTQCKASDSVFWFATKAGPQPLFNLGLSSPLLQARRHTSRARPRRAPPPWTIRRQLMPQTATTQMQERMTRLLLRGRSGRRGSGGAWSCRASCCCAPRATSEWAGGTPCLPAVNAACIVDRLVGALLAAR